MTEATNEPGTSGFSIMLSAPTLEELAELVAGVSAGLGALRRPPLQSPQGRPLLRSFQWAGAEEATLLRMKASGATWQEIADALGRTEKAIKLRWQRLRPTA